MEKRSPNKLRSSSSTSTKDKNPPSTMKTPLNPTASGGRVPSHGISFSLKKLSTMPVRTDNRPFGSRQKSSSSMSMFTEYGSPPESEAEMPIEAPTIDIASLPPPPPPPPPPEPEIPLEAKVNIERNDDELKSAEEKGHEKPPEPPKIEPVIQPSISDPGRVSIRMDWKQRDSKREEFFARLRPDFLSEDTDLRHRIEKKRSREKIKVLHITRESHSHHEPKDQPTRHRTSSPKRREDHLETISGVSPRRSRHSYKEAFSLERVHHAVVSPLERESGRDTLSRDPESRRRRTSANRENIRETTCLPRILVSCVREYRHDFGRLWDQKPSVLEAPNLPVIPPMEERSPSRESSVGIVIDEATNIEPMDLEEQAKDGPSELDIENHNKISFTFGSGGMKKPSLVPPVSFASKNEAFSNDPESPAKPESVLAVEDASWAKSAPMGNTAVTVKLEDNTDGKTSDMMNTYESFLKDITEPLSRSAERAKDGGSDERDRRTSREERRVSPFREKSRNISEGKRSARSENKFGERRESRFSRQNRDFVQKKTLDLKVVRAKPAGVFVRLNDRNPVEKDRIQSPPKSRRSRERSRKESPRKDDRNAGRREDKRAEKGKSPEMNWNREIRGIDDRHSTPTERRKRDHPTQMNPDHDGTSKEKERRQSSHRHPRGDLRTNSRSRNREDKRPHNSSRHSKEPNRGSSRENIQEKSPTKDVGASTSHAEPKQRPISRTEDKADRDRSPPKKSTESSPDWYRLVSPSGLSVIDSSPDSRRKGRTSRWGEADRSVLIEIKLDNSDKPLVAPQPTPALRQIKLEPEPLKSPIPPPVSSIPLPPNASPSPIKSPQQSPIQAPPPIVENELPFPPVVEPVTGTFPVPFNFEGTGPLFCWPYLLPDGSVVLVPYLSLQKQADPTQVEKLLLVPPMVSSSPPSNGTPMNLLAIQTYDPTRALPLPPPSASAPLNQPSKSGVVRLIKTQQTENEKAKNLVQRTPSVAGRLDVMMTPGSDSSRAGSTARPPAGQEATGGSIEREGVANGTGVSEMELEGQDVR